MRQSTAGGSRSYGGSRSRAGGRSTRAGTGRSKKNDGRPVLRDQFDNDRTPHPLYSLSEAPQSMMGGARAAKRGSGMHTSRVSNSASEDDDDGMSVGGLDASAGGLSIVSSGSRDDEAGAGEAAGGAGHDHDADGFSSEAHGDDVEATRGTAGAGKRDQGTSTMAMSVAGPEHMAGLELARRVSAGQVRSWGRMVWETESKEALSPADLQEDVALDLTESRTQFLFHLPALAIKEGGGDETAATRKNEEYAELLAARSRAPTAFPGTHTQTLNPDHKSIGVRTRPPRHRDSGAQASGFDIEDEQRAADAEAEGGAEVDAVVAAATAVAEAGEEGGVDSGSGGPSSGPASMMVVVPPGATPLEARVHKLVTAALAAPGASVAEEEAVKIAPLEGRRSEQHGVSLQDVRRIQVATENKEGEGGNGSGAAGSKRKDKTAGTSSRGTGDLGGTSMALGLDTSSGSVANSIGDSSAAAMQQQQAAGADTPGEGGAGSGDKSGGNAANIPMLPGERSLQLGPLLLRQRQTVSQSGSLLRAARAVERSLQQRVFHGAHRLYRSAPGGRGVDALLEAFSESAAGRRVERGARVEGPFEGGQQEHLARQQAEKEEAANRAREDAADRRGTSRPGVGFALEPESVHGSGNGSDGDGSGRAGSPSFGRDSASGADESSSTDGKGVSGGKASGNERLQRLFTYYAPSLQGLAALCGEWLPEPDEAARLVEELWMWKRRRAARQRAVRRLVEGVGASEDGSAAASAAAAGGGEGDGEEIESKSESGGALDEAAADAAGSADVQGVDVNGGETAPGAADGGVIEGQEDDDLDPRLVAQGARFAGAFAAAATGAELLAVGYGPARYSPAAGGALALWSMRNPQQPEVLLRTPSGVTCLAVAPSAPTLLGIGLYDGRVAVVDVARLLAREGPQQLDVLSDSLQPGAHTEAVRDLAWAEGEDEGERDRLVSASSDGRVNVWRAAKGLECHTLMQLKASPASEGPGGGAGGGAADGSETTAEQEPQPGGAQYTGAGAGTAPVAAGAGSARSMGKGAAGLCVAVPPAQTGGLVYFCGTEGGYVHVCSASYAESYLQSARPHRAPVTRIRLHPLMPDAALTASADWSSTLLDMGRGGATVRQFAAGDAQSAVADVRWCPLLPDRFAAVTEDGRVQVWRADGLLPLYEHSVGREVGAEEALAAEADAARAQEVADGAGEGEGKEAEVERGELSDSDEEEEAAFASASRAQRDAALAKERAKQALTEARRHFTFCLWSNAVPVLLTGDTDGRVDVYRCVGAPLPPLGLEPAGEAVLRVLRGAEAVAGAAGGDGDDEDDQLDGV